jgi:hypothetical protein
VKDTERVWFAYGLRMRVKVSGPCRVGGKRARPGALLLPAPHSSVLFKQEHSTASYIFIIRAAARVLYL